MRLDAVEALGDGQLELPPALARDQQRLLDPELVENRRELVQSPANDQPSRSFAKERNSSAARVAARPRPRTT